jgi:hypothetical protein
MKPSMERTNLKDEATTFCQIKVIELILLWRRWRWWIEGVQIRFDDTGIQRSG